ncbi:regulatory protein AfsR [Microcystis aeruginosa NIES-2520]|uniref:Regulatory protein AfsR n=1 Tax=Microcystis aeruginosa NIES-2520 TaxID=2303982 RepID=A0A5A5RJJ8_MICAE|nr:NB-ARC domain-containing protein [Microcystis aeruginosa]GCA75115.1 regulatory protein AfsR [Microcystis aeruginosa NIES-2520]
MPQFQPDRALEIVAPKYGTAYRIGGRLLLTCRHLFDNSNDCKVRFRSTSNYSDKQDIDAKVIWKAPDNIDIALVELPETIETCNPVGFGLLPYASSTQKVKFDFLGFPLFLRYSEDGIKYATGLHIEGTIDVANRAPHNRLLLNIKDSPDIQPTDEQLERLAEDQSPWQGTSGSAIVCYGLVIGVQSKQPIRDRPASLEAESLARVYDNPEWCEILENHDIDPEPKPVISASLKSSSYRNQAPPKPSYFVERPEVSIELKQLLLSEKTEKTGTLVISAIYGLGGIGKSTLAAALAQEKEVQAFFPDGIFWATLGQQPDILSFLHGWIQALGDYNFKPTGIDAASLHLRTLLADKKALLVVDDLWNVEDIDPFRVAVNQCKLLVTTREVPVKGAIRYDLDVMTETQSLALLTGYLKHELTLEDQKQAKILAKIVGYLPLALELTAAQVEDDIPWAELIEELQAEIANLEILDRLEAGDTANEEKRKHYSLIACFNLSLKRLSPQRLQQFIWLGVLPDDVTITEKMAITLWDCRLTEARKTLRYLRGKALLLTGVSSEQITNYRVHDLLHDLARNLLQASSHPEREYQLPGLGLSISEAHRQLLTRYQRQTKNGLWHSLEDDGYIYNQLIWHLEKAEKITEIHQLLREETAEGHNGWYSQCEREGKTAIFIKDVSRAWQLAEEHFIENPTKSIGLQVRYALITTSLNSLATNIPPELIAALIKHEIWTPAQGLAYVRQNQDDFGRAEGLKAISPYLTSTLLPEALEIAKGFGSEHDREWALIGLAPYLPEILPEAFAIARAIRDESRRAEALTGLAPHLPESLLYEALAVARAIRDESRRAEALTGLAPHLPESLLYEALAVARAIGDESRRAEALTGLAPHLPESLLYEALAVARAIGDEYNRALALTGLAFYVPTVLPEALAVDRAIWSESGRALRALALTGLAPHLPESLLFEALAVARRIGDAKALTGLAPHLPESLLPEALEVARGIENEYNRALALTGLAPHFPEVLPEALAVVRGIGKDISLVWQLNEYKLAEALTGLAPHLPESLLPEALEIARGIGNEHYRARALTELAPHLPESLLSEVLEVARAIGDEYNRAKALTGLAPYLPEVLPEALEVARRIGSEEYRAEALTGLAPHLPVSLLPEAIEIVGAIGNEYHRAEVLTGLAPHLPESLLPEALEVARGIRQEYHRAKALTGLAPYVPEVLSEALEVVRAIGYEYSRAKALTGLAPHLPESLLSEALEVARAIGYESYRAEALIGLAPHLSEALLSEALEVARAIGNTYHREEALTGFAPLKEVSQQQKETDRQQKETERRQQETDRQLKELGRQIGGLGAKFGSFTEGLALPSEALALAVAREYRYALALTGLAPHLPESLLPEALEIARGIRNEDNRAKALTGLAPYVPEVLSEALEVVRAIRYEYSRASALTGLAPHLPESLLSEALEVARRIGSEEYRAEALTGLAPHLPVSLLPEAIEIVGGIEDESRRAEALTRLAPYLPEVLPEALEIARGIGSEYHRALALKALTATLTPANVDLSFWENALHALGTLTRPHFLETIPNLAPLILHFGGEVALREVYQGIREVSRWWR